MLQIPLAFLGFRTISSFRTFIAHSVFFIIPVYILPYNGWVNTFGFLRSQISTNFFNILFPYSGVLSNPWIILELASMPFVIIVVWSLLLYNEDLFVHIGMFPYNLSQYAINLFIRLQERLLSWRLSVISLRPSRYHQTSCLDGWHIIVKFHVEDFLCYCSDNILRKECHSSMILTFLGSHWQLKVW